jgi:hypothetical protein
MRNINVDFFKDVDSELKAYLLGFHVADGCVFKHSEKSIGFKITLQARDVEIVKLFRDSIYPDGNIYISPARKDGWKTNETCSFKVVCTELCQHILNHGYPFRKTYHELHLPQIDNSLMPHFIRGYFDGNGSIRKSIITRLTGREAGRIVVNKQLDFTSNGRVILFEIQQELIKHDIKLNLVPHKIKYHSLRINSLSEISKMYNFLYKDATYFLKRKKDSFEQIMGTSSANN